MPYGPWSQNVALTALAKLAEDVYAGGGLTLRHPQTELTDPIQRPEPVVRHARLVERLSAERGPTYEDSPIGTLRLTVTKWCAIRSAGGYEVNV